MEEHRLDVHHVATRVFVLAYVTFIYAIDTRHYGDFTSWPSRLFVYPDWLTTAFRTSGVWERSACYFPTFMHKTAELPPDRPYVFATHPHGIISCGSQASFGTDVVGFKRLFPGLRVHLLGLNTVFDIPFFRELLMMNDCLSSSGDSFDNTLGRGDCVCIAIGGAKESLFPQRNKTCRLILKNRKGFVKRALKQGADIVPVFTFEENEVYRFFETSGVSAAVQRYLQRKLKFAIPLFWGNVLPLLPRPGELNVYVGSPVSGKRAKDMQGKPVTQEEVDRTHDAYCKALVTLFDLHKEAAGYPGWKLELV